MKLGLIKSKQTLITYCISISSVHESNIYYCTYPHELDVVYEQEVWVRLSEEARLIDYTAHNSRNM